MVEETRTTCPYCGVGCGVIVQADDAGWRVRGDPDHPANRGRLCSKGAALAETLGLDTRLLHPVVDGTQTGWEEAIAETARRIRSAIDQEGPDAFAFYLSGQLLTEDYYVANKLAKGYLGTANVDTNSRLCMASTVAGHRRAFGSDTVPGCYEDLELADLVVLVGSNLAWCHPVLFQRLKRAREERGTRVVVIDPRRTDSCDIADLHIPLPPGGDVALFNGLLAHLEAEGRLDSAFISAHTEGFAEALAAARTGTDRPAPDVERFYRDFAATERTVTVFSQGVNQSSQGSDKVNAILNVHLATGRIGRPGMGPFSVTGQPNAMGGREVGGLANQLAAHMGFDDASVDRVRRFWKAPRMATREGLKAVDLFRAVDEGRVKALWIMATNPAVSLPEADLVRRALDKCPVVIVSDCVADTDTLRHAHIRLPALAWGEKDGTVTNSDRTLSRQRAFLQPPGEARADWRAIAEVARHLGHGAAFAWTSPAEVFDEYARQTAFENGGRRDLDLSAWVGADYETMRPAPWGGPRFFASGRFHHPDGRARFVAVRPMEPRETTTPSLPLRPNTGRYRDQWHTMTRTGLSPRLSGHRPEPLLDIHPADAAELGLADGQLARVESRCGDYLARVRATPDQGRGEVFLPLHWNDVHAARSVIGRLVPAHVDPLSGQPELKHVPVRVRPWNPSWHGLLVTAHPVEAREASWWVRHRADKAQVLDMAGDDPRQQDSLIARLDREHGAERIEVVDPVRRTARYGWLVEGRLAAVLFLSPQRPDAAQGWLAKLVGEPLTDASGRAAVLAGHPASPVADEGRLVCACFSVGLRTLERIIGEQRLATVAEIGQHLKAGTGCGSCVAELRSLLRARDAVAQAS
ncbi:MAG: molybdopterin-dependent oxidoreductase [Alphaproteobacteria bacterium]|nr:molybdopterin-dependent oxidoreductase [Alphaproteobacteria bacterium]